MKSKSLSLIICVFLLNACSSVASIGKENRKVGSFSKIRAESGIDVYFTQQKTQSIEVEADSEVLEKIITEVQGETLIIKRENDNKGIKSGKNRTVKVYVHASVLDEIKLSGGSDFYVDDLTCSHSFSVAASGGSDAHIGQLNASNSVDIAVSGGSDCNVKQLKTKKCNLAASGGGDININLDDADTVSAAASGGSDIKLSGKANKVSAAASGGSDIDVRKLIYNDISAHKSGGSDIYQ